MNEKNFYNKIKNEIIANSYINNDPDLGPIIKACLKICYFTYKLIMKEIKLIKKWGV